MVGFLRFNLYNRVVLSSLLFTFPLAVLIPPPAYAQVNIGFNDINFGIAMQKLIDKAWKYYTKQDSDSLVDVLLDIKGQVESYRGIKINIEKEIDRAEVALKKKGHKAPKEVFKRYKSLLKKKEKKNHHRALCMDSLTGFGFLVDQGVDIYQNEY